MTAPATSPGPDSRAQLRAAETCWPLYGSATFDDLDTDWRALWAKRLRSDLQRHVIEPWFPRCVDTEAGGFLCDFDGVWQARGDQVRMLEFQARQTRTAARLGQAFPNERRWREYTEHGLEALNETMRDPVDGGWFWLVDRAGKPLANGTKHGHSTAYLIAAYVESYRLTADASHLDSAREVFDWLETVLHDSEHSGYRTWATRDGRPILDAGAPEVASDAKDPLGHDVGLKDANVHSDLLEALRLLYAEWPDPVLRERLAELYRILMDVHGRPDGSMHYVLADDLTPVPSLEQYGYPAQTGSRLIKVAPLIGTSVEDAFAWATTGLRHVLRDGRHPNGSGILNESAPAPPFRPWWVQTEVLELQLLLAARDEDGQYFAREFDDLYAFVNRELLDHVHGGWYPRARSEWGIRSRLLAGRVHKANRWKDASHETDMYLGAIRLLRGLEATAPLEPQ